MANRDINLFKAAGGDRAKGAKRSPLTYMVIFAIIVIVAAIGAGVYFNLKANKAVSEYEEKETIKSNYNSTKIYVRSTAEEYQKVYSDILAAAAINGYVDYESSLYPHATETEIAAVRETIVNNIVGESFSINEPEEGEPFTPRDYEGLRESLYEESAEEVAERELFYFGLQKLAEEQAKSPDKSVWCTYYRCYLLVVFTGGDGMGLSSLCDSLISGSGTMEGQVPFSRFSMPNDIYADGYYTPAKFTTKVYNEENYNIMLLPLKSVIERMMDILEAHSAALVEENGWESQLEFASYAVNDIDLTNDTFKFTLTIPEDSSFKGYMDAFDASVFFYVDEKVARYDAKGDGTLVDYNVILHYTGRAVAETQAD